MTNSKLKHKIIDAELLTTNITQIAKNCARSDAQKALIGRILFMIENMPTIEVEPDNGWISVKDRLPDENQKCLVYRDIDNDLKITTGIWHSDRKTFDGLRHGTRLENTIAWMPLPEPPKGE